MMNLHKFIFSPFSENTYIIWDNIKQDAAIIDPGCYNENEENQLDSFIVSNGLNIKYLINTHCHIDHIFGNAYVKKQYNPIFLIPELDLPLLKMGIEQAKMYGVELKPSPEPDEFLTENFVINLGDNSPKFLFTPGHTPGEYCIYFEKEKICITGDVLFFESIGRTDLWGGNFDTLISSIKNKLFTLTDDTIVYPGHGDKTSIGYEKENNPFINQ
jgi:glyoxylase-like metal-dependent hydrolase (beta-lactamase superfamily II)